MIDWKWFEGVPGLDPARWPPDVRFANAVGAFACAVHVAQADPSLEGWKGLSRGQREAVFRNSREMRRWFSEAGDDPWDAYIRRQSMAMIVGMPDGERDIKVLLRRAGRFYEHLTETE